MGSCITGKEECHEFGLKHKIKKGLYLMLMVQWQKISSAKYLSKWFLDRAKGRMARRNLYLTQTISVQALSRNIEGWYSHRGNPITKLPNCTRYSSPSPQYQAKAIDSSFICYPESWVHLDTLILHYGLAHLHFLRLHLERHVYEPGPWVG